MKRALFLLTLLLCLSFCSCSQPSGTNPDINDDPPAKPPASQQPETPQGAKDPQKEYIEAQLNSMSLEEKVGQVFFVRCPSAQALEDISRYHLGGYLLFARDYKDDTGTYLTAEAFLQKIDSYQSAAAIPLLIGTDEEGGTVTRASQNPHLFPQKRRSPQSVYASGGLTAVEEETDQTSRALLSYGINVNFAPVADVSTDPSDFIYARSLGQNAETTADYIRCAVGTMRTAGIGSVLKHFPGYGNNADTHTGIAVDQRPYQQFLTQDFLPFQAGIEAGAGAVLVSHNIVNCMDPALPASLSAEVHRVLREDLGFNGVILTDDLAMDAVASYAQDGSAAVLALQAGNDMVVTTDYRNQIPLVIAAVENGTISQTQLDAAVTRVLQWKLDLGLISLS